MNRIIVIVALVIAVVPLAFGEAPQNQAGQASQQSITLEKRSLIKELFELTQLHNQMGQMTEAMLAQLEKQQLQLFSQSIKDGKELTDAEREARLKSITQQTQRVRELLTRRVNFSQLIEEVMYPLYDKYFTEDDLKGVIAFYKSPAGRKFVEAGPKLTIESITKINELLVPQMQQLLRDITEEEKSLKQSGEKKGP